jgi:DNA-binding LacI/PurR family transcriptional regulator/DNA-binding transcriptional regulator YhcF (GntR family)
MGSTASPRRTPRLETALQLLRDRLTGGMSALPSLRALAAEGGVSYVTMWKASAILKSEGLIDRRPSVRLRSPVDKVPPPQAPSGYRWEQVAARIRTGILDGSIGHEGLLPPPKTLRAQFGVTHRTLNAALSHLAVHGDVEPYRRTWRSRLPHTKTHGRAAVLLLTREDPSAGVALMTPRAQELFRAVESECGRAGIVLEVTRTGDLSAVSSFRKRHGTAALGCMAWVGDLRPAQLRSFIPGLSRHGLPVALLDETGDAATVLPNVSAPNVRLFTLATSTSAGRALGRHLLAMGHRRVAFISPLQRTIWSRNRLIGLREVIQAPGAAGVVDDFSEDIDQRTLRSADRNNRLRRALDSFVARRPLQGAGMEARIDGGARDLRRLLGVGRTQGATWDLAARALRDGRATAWVAVRDAVAVECRRLLDEHGMRVPRDLALASFDDSLDAFFLQMTSYNYNCQAVTRAMLGALLDRGRNSAAKGSVEIEGFITMRASTSRMAGE